MPDIHIERNHALGIAGAREVARQWIEQVGQDYGLECTYTEGEACDVAQFSRAGIDGTVEVTADTLTLEATLGFLFSSFSDQIEQKISRKLDALLQAPGGGGARFA
ncbi:polyhydroxyalkanoic acid system family protein [Variovorax paradoxus]|uniref:polyhydroxyalkanoic acid system family protein n=1 Tax=Variovorax paradoxus TaxID=34073 RepID=UPI003999B733